MQHTFITQWASTWIMWLLPNEVTHALACFPNRSRARVKKSLAIKFRIRFESLEHSLVIMSALRMVSQRMRSDGKWIPLQCSRRTHTVSMQGGERNKKIYRRRINTRRVVAKGFKDERTKQGFAFPWTALKSPGGGHGIEPFSAFSHPHHWVDAKNTPMPLPPSHSHNVCGSRVKCGSFCAPTRPIITVQSTNNRPLYLDNSLTEKLPRCCLRHGLWVARCPPDSFSSCR